jgi:two-component system, OmpR family, response regulator
MRDKVLVIEDHRDLYPLFHYVLQFYGFEVTVVSDGTKAMELLKESTPFDAITLDLHLPGTPGTVIFDMLEKRGDAKKVLVISAYLGEIKDLEIRGANALQKPILSIDLLVDRVKEIVEKKVPSLHDKALLETS